MPKYMPEKRFSFISNSSALDQEAFGVVQFSGVEGISLPYEFEIMLVSDTTDIDLDEVMAYPAKFTIHRKNGDDVDFHGILNSFEQLHKYNEYVFYRAHLVPRLWWLSITHHNQVCLNKSVPDIIALALKDSGLTKLDFEFKTRNSYKPIEYVCQYNESHFNFISRWLEREGLYYYFDQKGPAEKIIFTDTNIAHTNLPDVSYAPPEGLLEDENVEIINSFTCRQRQLPQKILLKDYNYQRPSLGISGSADVDSRGRGTDYIYGEYFATSEDGDRLAGIRAEILNCRRREFIGESTIPFIEPGYTFTLSHHYRESFNQQYLVESISHEGNQMGYLLPSIAEGVPEYKHTIYYRNSFTVIPSDVQYRAEKKSNRPYISGALHAKIDAEASGKYAELDDQGRYKVRLPFDESDDHKSGKASTWLRMMQPYANQAGGMQFPLTKGTEVLLTFIDGDPDRPVIAGAIANPETPSPVSAKNQTESVIQTGGNNKIRMEDLEGKERIIMESPTAGSWVRIGAPNDPPDPYQLISTKTVNDLLAYTDSNGTWNLVEYNGNAIATVNTAQNVQDNDKLKYEISATVKIRNRSGAAVLCYQKNGVQICSGNDEQEHLSASVKVTANVSSIPDYYVERGGKIPYTLLANNTSTIPVGTDENITAFHSTSNMISVSSKNYTIKRNVDTKQIFTSNIEGEVGIGGISIIIDNSFVDTITEINGTSSWIKRSSVTTQEVSDGSDITLNFYRQKEVTVNELNLKNIEGENDGIRLHSDKNLWIEAYNRYAEYRIGVRADAPRKSTTDSDPKIGDLIANFGSCYKPEGMLHRQSQSAQSFDEVLRNAHVKVSSMDTINTQEGNIYDFGGYWNYNLGNCYVENHMNQQAELNVKNEHDRLDIGGPAWQTINENKISEGGSWTNGNVWVTKKFGNSYDYIQGSSIEVRVGNTQAIKQGGKHVEIQYDSTGGLFGKTIETFGVKEEWGYNGTESDMLSYSKESWGLLRDLTKFSISNFGIENSLELKACAENKAELKFAGENSFSLHGGEKAEASVFIGAKAEINLAASLNFKLEGGTSLGLEIEANTGGKYEANLISGEHGGKWLGFTAQKAAALEAKVKEVLFEQQSAELKKNQFLFHNGNFDLKNCDIYLANRKLAFH